MPSKSQQYVRLGFLLLSIKRCIGLLTQHLSLPSLLALESYECHKSGAQLFHVIKQYFRPLYLKTESKYINAKQYDTKNNY